MPPLLPFRSRSRGDSANAWARSPQGATRLAGQDREANPPVCLVSRLGERRSKEAYSVFAIALGAAAPPIAPPGTAARTRFAHSRRPEHSEIERGVRSRSN